jgi:hypothetical protein
MEKKLEELIKEKNILLELQKSKTRFLSQEEFERLHELSNKLFELSCCTPDGQIKKYLNCVGCDKNPQNTFYIENKNITAVQWLIRQQKHNKYFDDETIEKAIEMENRQSHYYYNQGVKDDYFIGYDEFIKYHNETYGN